MKCFNSQKTGSLFSFADSSLQSSTFFSSPASCPVTQSWSIGPHWVIALWIINGEQPDCRLDHCYTAGYTFKGKNTGLFPVCNAVLVFLLLVSIRKIIIWFCKVEQLPWKFDAVHYVCKFKCRSKNHIVSGSKLLGIPIKMWYTWCPCLVNTKKGCPRYTVNKSGKWATIVPYDEQKTFTHMIA